jgi:hypothetical protein
MHMCPPGSQREAADAERVANAVRTKRTAWRSGLRTRSASIGWVTAVRYRRRFG